MASDFESLRAKSQKALLDFLSAELQLGATFVHSAQLAQNDEHTEHYLQAKHAAEKASESLHKFISHVHDDRERAEIEHGLAELDRRISVL